MVARSLRGHLLFPQRGLKAVKAKVESDRPHHRAVFLGRSPARGIHQVVPVQVEREAFPFYCHEGQQVLAGLRRDLETGPEGERRKASGSPGHAPRLQCHADPPDLPSPAPQDRLGTIALSLSSLDRVCRRPQHFHCPLERARSTLPWAQRGIDMPPPSIAGDDLENTPPTFPSPQASSSSTTTKV